ncbi:MAG: acetate CoA/acetoacetate CoA-transferase beta subunit [Clostridiales bacterium]|jgi:3-oxoacid CoA-transferase subunit B/acetate CoA/acetoacetate CoA-transferase beta subunit|nr:acetate CoA/acetoacetate CoA-transferase beta subunit [Clostridiales bacterium]
MNQREIIARRIAQEFENGAVINLGFGMPTMAANYIPEGIEVVLQTENGGLMFGGAPKKGEHSADMANAGGEPITMPKGSSAFDLAFSFCIIRGGHVDATVLGALEVDENGNIANWKIPGKFVPGMGGGMDLLVGAKKVVAALAHTDKEGNSKVLKSCTLPLSAAGVVKRIITDIAVFDVAADGLVLVERAPGVSVEEITAKTEAAFTVSPEIKEMVL